MMLLDRRRGMGSKSPDDIIMTIETNPEVLTICYAQGWCANADYMTATEASLVTNIGTKFANSNIKNFDELQYFAVTSIAQYAFQGCKRLVSIAFPSTVSSIGSRAFYQTNSVLKKITVYRNTAPSIVNNSLYGVARNGTLYVPTGSTGYNIWMKTENYYLGSCGWTKVEF